jgi:hypothetical protein
MATGTVFIYLLIAALLSPVVWVMWWGVASLGGSARLSTAPAKKHVARPRSSFSFPQPADMTLPRQSGANAISWFSNGKEIGACIGPDHDGKCPRVRADGTVPCAGSVVSLPRLIRGSAEWQIPFGYRTCLTGSYEVFRQPAFTHSPAGGAG